MDDFPASPASPGPRRPPLSVVVPVHNGGRDLERCLLGLRSNIGVDFEVVVVDDGSTDASSRVASSYGARVIRHATPRGPAAARNVGAEAAHAPIVFFLDADVVPHRDTLARAFARFQADPGLSALFGSYDDRPDAHGVVSRYRNLLHHYVHQQGEFVDDARPAHTFWTGCGAIRRSVFLEVGGFDPSLYRRPAIEDIELGYRLAKSGHRVLLCRDVRATHLKRWTLRAVVRTDIFCRGVPWMLLMLRSRSVETDLNVSRSQRASVALTGMAIASAPAMLANPFAAVLPIVCLLAIFGLNRDFYKFLARTGGRRFAFASFPLHLLYFVCCGASVALAFAINALPRRASQRWKSQAVRAEPGAASVPGPRATQPTPSREPSAWTDRP